MLVANPTTSQIKLLGHPLLLRNPLDEPPASLLVLLRKDDAVEVVWNACRVCLTLHECSIGKDTVSMVARNGIDQRSRVGRESRVDGMVVGQDDFQPDELAVDYLVVRMNLQPVSVRCKDSCLHKLTMLT